MSKFKDMTLGQRLHMVTNQSLKDIEGNQLRKWFYMSDAERQAFENEGLRILLEEGIDSTTFVNAALKVIKDD